MKALAFLLLTQTKNKILSLRKKPVLMILYGFILLIFIGSVVYLIFAGDKQINKTYADSRIIYLFLSGFGLLYLFTFTYSGLSTGSTFFTMADVGLLFVAPISTKKILFYGLISAFGKAMFTSVFIFYQIPNLKNMFGYGVVEVVALFFIYVILVIFCQILSIGVYIFSNGNKSRKNLVKLLLYILFAFLIMAVFLIIKKENVELMEAVKILVDRSWFGLLPIMGWVIMFFKGVLTGGLLYIVISLALFALSSILCISLLTAHEADYYEDVLQSTEITYQRLIDYKEGRNISSTTNRKVKVKDKEIGFNRGKGAIMFAYKHFLEMKRTSRFIFVDVLTIIITIGVSIGGLSIKNEMSSYIILASVIYLQFFITVFGRLKIELMKPYIFMIPEPSSKKLFAASISSLLKPCVDSVFIFSALAIVGGASIPHCIFMAIAYICSGAVFVGLTIVYQRLLGAQPNQVVQMFIGIFLMLLVFLPAVLISVLFSAFILPGSLQFLSSLPYSIICLILAYIMFLSCGNLLDNTEISENKK